MRERVGGGASVADVVYAQLLVSSRAEGIGWAGALLVAGPLAVHGLVVIGAVGVLHVQRVDKAASPNRVSARARHADTMERCGQPTCYTAMEAEVRGLT